MKSILLFPFRVIAFFVRMALYVIAIPLFILIRILGLLLPETSRALNSAISALIGIFKF